MDENGLKKPLRELLGKLDGKEYTNLSQIGKKVRELIHNGEFSDSLSDAIIKGNGRHK
ncbi:hypothetical protein FGF1_25660 [Flavobacteriaceae bacterium GF1]